MTITAGKVKELRDSTGAGMMECKKALEEAGGDKEEAILILRKKGQLKAAKRAGKVAAEGNVANEVSQDQKTAFMAEVNCETDFVARDNHFKEFVKELVEQGLKHRVKDVDGLLALHSPNHGNVPFDQVRQELAAKIGENINVRRVALVESTGIVGAYTHGDRIGVLVAINKNVPELAKDIAMHIAASNPLAVDQEDIANDIIEKEREVYSAQAKESGKPDDIIEKMVAGRLVKFFQEVCLVSQPFVKNPDQTVGALLQQHQAKVIAFVRFEVGEGIEKETVDFAEEVKAQIKGN